MKFDLLLYILKATGNHEASLTIMAFIGLLNLTTCLYFIFLSFKIWRFLKITWCFISKCFYRKDYSYSLTKGILKPHTENKKKRERERIPSFLKLIILLLYLTLFVKREKRAAVFCHEDCLWQLNHFILHNENDFSVSKGTTSGWVSTWRTEWATRDTSGLILREKVSTCHWSSSSE